MSKRLAEATSTLYQALQAHNNLEETMRFIVSLAMNIDLLLPYLVLGLVFGLMLLLMFAIT